MTEEGEVALRDASRANISCRVSQTLLKDFSTPKETPCKVLLVSRRRKFLGYRQDECKTDNKKFSAVLYDN